MKIIRWLLSHTFLILLIVAVIYGYMFWGNLAGEDTPAGKALAYLSSEFVEVGEFVAAIKAKQKKLSQHESSEAPEPSPESDVYAAAESAGTGADSSTQIPIAETQTAEKTVEKTDFTAPVDENRSADYAVADDRSDDKIENRNDYRSLEQQQVSISYSHNRTRVKQNAGGIIETAVEPVDYVATANLRSKRTLSDVQSSSDETGDTFVPTEIENQLNNVDSQGRLKDDSSQQDDAIRASWITARKSFYQRKYALSEQKYQHVIDNTDDNYDAYGELGNVYFNQGKKEQAAKAYFAAAAILFRKGQVNRARSLIGLLRHLDKSKANELQKLIDSSLS